MANNDWVYIVNHTQLLHLFLLLSLPFLLLILLLLLLLPMSIMVTNNFEVKEFLLCCSKLSLYINGLFESLLLPCLGEPLV